MLGSRRWRGDDRHRRLAALRSVPQPGDRDEGDRERKLS
jgi:hypothetical protein